VSSIDEPLLSYHVDDIVSALNRSIPTGLYIVQSKAEPSCFRAGAGGVQGDRSTLINRLRQHMSRPPNRNDIDWTEYHRGWNVRWAVQFPSCDRLTGRLCEALLIAELAREYHFIPEATGSGFHSDRADEVVKFARGLEPKFLPLLKRQANRPALRRWEKGTKEGLPSRYLD
jgi:hypothetical protein